MGLVLSPLYHSFLSVMRLRRQAWNSLTPQAEKVSKGLGKNIEIDLVTSFRRYYYNGRGRLG